jgi:hypothetical protein
LGSIVRKTDNIFLDSKEIHRLFGKPNIYLLFTKQLVIYDRNAVDEQAQYFVINDERLSPILKT